MAIVRVFSGTDPVLLDKAVRDAVKAALGDESADFALAELTESDYHSRRRIQHRAACRRSPDASHADRSACRPRSPSGALFHW